MLRVDVHPVIEIPEGEEFTFFFDGRPLRARRGEVIASAMFAHGIRTFGRHPRTGTPQGIFCANGQCAQCLVIADGRPVKACMTQVRDGMNVHALDNFPAVPPITRDRIDFTAIEEASCDLLVVGAGPAGLSAAAPR